MAYEQKPNTGSSFENLDKRDSRSPDYTGSALIDGKTYFFDVWRNTTGAGKEFLSAKFKPKQKQPTPQVQTGYQAPPQSAGDDSVPF